MTIFEAPEFKEAIKQYLKESLSLSIEEKQESFWDTSANNHPCTEITISLTFDGEVLSKEYFTIEK